MSPKKKLVTDAAQPVNSLDELEALKRRIAELEGGKQNGSSEIRMDELIPVMSLLSYPLNLSTKERGQGDTFRFDQYGQIKRILYSKLLSILEVHSNFVNWGYFIILDERVIRAHGLQEAYQNILTKEKIDSILSGAKGALDLYKSCSAEQQKTIVSMMIEKLRENLQSIDMNLVDQISRISGVKIIEKAEESRLLFPVEMK